jgi:Flp pilus assembly protein TadG
LIEFALVLPLMLVLILGVFQVGLLLLMRTELVHAAQQGAIAGAAEPAVPRRCTTAIATAEVIYGSAPDDSQCAQPGNIVTLRLLDAVPVVSPFGPWTVDVTARAVTR